MNDTELKLLNDYKEYDYLNTNRQTPLIKILVSYIKPSFLFKSDILTPIHLGRAVETEISKDGKISDKDLEWLHQNCLSDDNFNNSLSEYNRRIGFFTGTWWAYNNYEKLGNPDYFGSFGYRRLLSASFLPKLKEYDVFLPRPKKLDDTIKKQFILEHGNELYEALINVFSKTYPSETEDLKKYFEQNYGYFDELYILKKDLFFNFAQWINKFVKAFFKLYPVPIKINRTPQQATQLMADFFQTDRNVLTKITEPQQPTKEYRDIAFCLERLTGYYLSRLINTSNNIQYLEVATKQTKSLNPTLDKMILSQLRKNIAQKESASNE